MKQHIYFVGAGGIGMANLVRYFLSKGMDCAGYDRSPSDLTSALEAEGALLTYGDSADNIPETFRNPADTLVVYTPAVPESNGILSWFRAHGFEVVKRARLLGLITRDTDSICVAGSHGKTTTCSMIANIMRHSPMGVNAFLGGILRNTGSNLVLSDHSPVSVIEADEYDRSFHQLTPTVAVVTSTDPDHLDIYGDEEHYLEAFSIFTSLIREEGALIMHTGLKMKPDVKPGVRVYTYSGGAEGDWHAEDIAYGEGTLSFTLCGPDGLRLPGMEPGVPVGINIDNAVAAAAAAIISGAPLGSVRYGLRTFRGAKRRFEILLDGKQPNPGQGEEKRGGETGQEGSGKAHAKAPVLIDDYAHSPKEVEASIKSVKKLYPGRKLTVIFQPHLYTRTRDFAGEFAAALSAADEVIMPEIYPAREEPIAGVDSMLILKDVTSAEKTYCERKDLLNLIENSNFEILMTLGAADIDRMLPDIKRILEGRVMRDEGRGTSYEV